MNDDDDSNGVYANFITAIGSEFDMIINTSTTSSI